VNVVVHPDADEELALAVDWYEARQIGLGEEFEEDVLLAFDLIGDNPEAWTRWPNLPEVRVLPMDRFPYLIPYHVASPEEVVILAVAHAKRRPGYWRWRVPSR
jgi:toxin ParE1/3/4